MLRPFISLPTQLFVWKADPVLNSKDTFKSLHYQPFYVSGNSSCRGTVYYSDIIKSVSKHQPHNCLHNLIYRRRSKKTSKLRITGLFVGNSPVTGEFPTQKASNMENISLWWRHHEHRKSAMSWHYHEITRVGENSQFCVTNDNTGWCHLTPITATPTGNHDWWKTVGDFKQLLNGKPCLWLAWTNVKASKLCGGGACREVTNL